MKFGPEKSSSFKEEKRACSMSVNLIITSWLVPSRPNNQLVKYFPMHDLYYMERIKYNLYYRLSKYTKEVSQTSMFVFTCRLEFSLCIYPRNGCYPKPRNWMLDLCKLLQKLARTRISELVCCWPTDQCRPRSSTAVSRPFSTTMTSFLNWPKRYRNSATEKTTVQVRKKT